MSAAPLAIVGCGLPHTEAHWVIFVHVMGMFVPSFFTGNLITRYGVLNIMLIGTAVFLIGIVCGLAGIDAWNFRIALMLNGLGWNFLFVGATTLVTTTYRPSERGKAQALNDFLVFGTTTTCSFMAGVLQHHYGWNPLNWLSVGLVAVAIAAVGWLRLAPPRAAQAA
jgi:MFS family permease